MILKKIFCVVYFSQWYHPWALYIAYISTNLNWKISFGGKVRFKCWVEMSKNSSMDYIPWWSKVTLTLLKWTLWLFYTHLDVFRHFLRNIYLSKAGRDPLQAHWHKLWVTSRRLPPSSTYSNESSWPQTWS